MPLISGAFFRSDRRSDRPADYVQEQGKTVLIDDFSEEGNISAIGTSWRMFTDRVMGGVSDATHAFETWNGRRCIHLKGNVSLANNGGFIQVALSLERKGKVFDAGHFRGVRLWARGNGKTYALHLRSKHNRLPWHYYGAKFVAAEDWQQIDLPFEAFEPENHRRKLDPGSLKRIAIVAIGEEFEADIAVSRLEFY
ncbi:CIA30 family protein [Acidobacteriota bacterium]